LIKKEKEKQRERERGRERGREGGREGEREGERERGRELIINVCSAGLVPIQSLAPYIEYWHLKFPTPHFKTCETSGI
jgi:hypothetical protein